jgi:acetyl-CoA synthetase
MVYYCTGYYLTGDGGWRDKDGFYWITGRVDGMSAACAHHHRRASAITVSANITHPI